MGYGLWYAVFRRHQATGASAIHSPPVSRRQAERKTLAGAEKLSFSSTAGEIRLRSPVDVHGHWIGLAMLLIGSAIGFYHVHLPEKVKLLLAWALFLGSALFPLGVLMQTWKAWFAAQSPSPSWGSAWCTIALAGTYSASCGKAE